MTTDPKRLKILLIDDEPFIRTTIRQILGMIGFPNGNIYEADSSPAGLLETLRIRPDLVLCDIHMPEEDGFAYVEKLRSVKVGEIASTPVVMLTSDAHQETVLKAKKLNVRGYIVKPVAAATVKRAVENAVDVTLP